jgi:hypothetical protein
MNRVDQPEAWDVTVAGETWSGAAEVAGLKYSMGWDIQDADGKNNASLARKGRKLSRFTIRFGMVVDPSQGIDQQSEWYDIWVPLLKSCFTGETPTGLSLENAEAQALEVDSFVVEDIGQVQRVGEDDGEGYADVACIQYAPAKTVSTKGPGGTKTGGGGGYGAEEHGDPIQDRLNALNELLDGP